MFDTINRDVLWVTLGKYEFLHKLISIIHLMHDNMMVVALSDGQQSDPFGILSGIKQGCVLTPVLFNLFFSSGAGVFDKGLQQGHILLRKAITVLVSFSLCLGFICT